MSICPTTLSILTTIPILKRGLKFLPPEGTVKTWPKWLTENKPSPTGRITFSAWRLWKKGDPLQPSGLIEVPVTLESLEQIEVPLCLRNH